MTFGKKIKALRDAQEISQEKLSEMTGVPFEKISEWENDQAGADIVDILSVCECLDTSMDYLFADEIKGTGKSTKGSEKSICDERGIRCEFPEISGFGHTIAGIVMLTVVLCGTYAIQCFHMRFDGTCHSEAVAYLKYFPFTPLLLLALLEFVWGICKLILNLRKSGIKASLRFLYHEKNDHNFIRHKVYERVYDVIYIWTGIAFIFMSVYGAYAIQYLDMKTYGGCAADAFEYSITFPFSLVIILGFILLAVGMYRIIQATKRRIIERNLEKDKEKRKRKTERYIM